ncbi:MAG: hypothetical protein ACRD6X_19270 [Pyrinomonadaceae bacterium]
MSENGQKKKIDKIEAETSEIKRRLMQLEFQHKKDIAEAEKRFNARDNMIQKRLDHLSKLAGITYEEMEFLDEKLVGAGRELAKPRKHSTIS